MFSANKTSYNIPRVNNIKLERLIESFLKKIYIIIDKILGDASSKKVKNLNELSMFKEIKSIIK
tara:strand:- start:246 stop:437 length:192 start_codon:yes stop_codon:yes gene_type:complete